MIFVTGRNKRAIEDHFDTAYELEHELEEAGKNELLSWCAPMPADMDCILTFGSRRRWASAMRCCARSRRSATSRSPCCSPTT